MLITQNSLTFFNVFSNPNPNPQLFLSPISTHLHRPNSNNLRPVSAHNHHLEQPWLAQEVTAEDLTAPQAVEDTGPIELPSSVSSLFTTSDNPTTLQTATSVLLTGAITVFLFRSIRRRAKRAKEQKFRSSGAKKSVKEEALESLKAITPTLNDAKAPPSPVQALLGGLTAGVIAVILYKFTITIEATLGRQSVSDNFSVRQITITIRTIINGLCYLATFVFGINSIGLFLYSGQLAMNSFMGDSTGNEPNSKSEAQMAMPDTKSEDLADGSEMKSDDKNQSTDDKQL